MIAITPVTLLNDNRFLIFLTTQTGSPVYLRNLNP